MAHHLAPALKDIEKWNPVLKNIQKKVRWPKYLRFIEQPSYNKKLHLVQKSIKSFWVISLGLDVTQAILYNLAFNYLIEKYSYNRVRVQYDTFLYFIQNDLQ